MFHNYLHKINYLLLHIIYQLWLKISLLAKPDPDKQSTPRLTVCPIGQYPLGFLSMGNKLPFLLIIIGSVSLFISSLEVNKIFSNNYIIFTTLFLPRIVIIPFIIRYTETIIEPTRSTYRVIVAPGAIATVVSAIATQASTNDFAR